MKYEVKTLKMTRIWSRRQIIYNRNIGTRDSTSLPETMLLSLCQLSFVIREQPNDCQYLLLIFVSMLPFICWDRLRLSSCSVNECGNTVRAPCPAQYKRTFDSLPSFLFHLSFFYLGYQTNLERISSSIIHDILYNLAIDRLHCKYSLFELISVNWWKCWNEWTRQWGWNRNKYSRTIFKFTFLSISRISPQLFIHSMHLSILRCV
jgi:hypothetical protein